MNARIGLAPFEELASPRTAANAIARHIASLISNGTLLPGTTIDPASVASKFGATRAEVIQAVIELGQRGLVCIRPDLGVFVSRLSISEFLQMMELLAEVEGACAKLATRRLSPGYGSALQSAHDESRDCEQKGDVFRYCRANATFHEILYHACHNDALVDEIIRIRARTQVYRRSPFESLARIRNSHTEHGRVLEAVLGGDPFLAAERMVEHISIGARELTAYLSHGSSRLLSFDADFPGRTLARQRATMYESPQPVHAGKSNARRGAVVQDARSYILCHRYFGATIERAAKALGMSARTLTRRLAAEGITFQRLKDELRHKQALKMIREGKQPIAQVASDLGFSDTSSFYRAFRNWTGSTPGEFGAQMNAVPRLP
jgi:DNA-binding GntR family transcriptional regulator/AraC-like DNA-binding protein